MNRQMLKFLLLFVVVFHLKIAMAQVTNVSGDYVHKMINTTGNGDFTKSLILLHEIYDNTLLADNYIVGTIAARRGSEGAFNRLNVANINSSSSYNATFANLVSNDEESYCWQLKTCRYKGKKYIALDVPYAAWHGNGIQFIGWVKSSGLSLEFVIYEKNNTPQNTEFLSEIADYSANRQITNYVSRFNVLGRVGIGTANPQADLSVNGNILAKEIKVKTDIAVPDYVFEPDYKLKSLEDIESYVKENKHLPEIPSAKQIQADGLDVAGMNLLLLKKIEEMTLHMIDQQKQILEMKAEIRKKNEDKANESRNRK